MNHKLDILIMSDNNLETVGGEQESTKIILDNLKNDYKIGVIQPGEIKNKFSNVNYYCLSHHTRIKHIIKNPIAFLNYIVNIKNIVNEIQPKVIHTQAQISFFVISILKKMKFISKEIKLIHTERGLYEKYNELFKRVFFFCMSNLDVLVTTTEFNFFSWNSALTSKNINLDYIVIPNTAGKKFEHYDKYLTKKGEEFIVGFSGRFTDWKNWPLAVEISEGLYNKLNQKVKIKMAVGCLDGKSEKATKEMFKHLNSIFGEKFIGKINISLDEMDQFYYDIDLFILTSKYNTESFGRTLVEAMSRKTAVLTTDAGGSAEVVGDSNKVLHSSSEFVERALELFNNPKLLEKEKVSNLKRVKDNYSLQNNIQKHKELYEKIINKEDVS